MPDVNPDELTVTLVDEAARLYDELGPHGLSLRRLATAAGTSTMTVYTRFGDKQGLLTAMLREGFRRLGARLAAADDADDPLAALAALGLAYRAAALASPHLYGLMFGRRPADLVPSAEDEAAARSTYEPLRAGVQRAVDARVLQGDPDRIALHLWSVTHGMIGLELAGQLTDDPDASYAEALALAAAPFLVIA